MEESSAFAPIVLFAYNRPEHTRQLLESMNRNPEAANSNLIVFCDGPKEGASPEMLERIKKVRETVRNTARCKSLTLHVSEKNWGLAPSVIAGKTAPGLSAGWSQHTLPICTACIPTFRWH